MSVDLAVSRLRRAVAGGIDLEAAVRGEPEAVSAAGAVGLAARGRAELRGAGVVLQPLLDDPAVTDVLVNGGGGVWVDRGDGLEVVPAAARALGGAAAVRALATRLAAAAGQRLDDACPVVDGSLADGTRLHVILPPLAPEGPLISLRTQRRRAFTLAELVAARTVAPALAPVLRALVTRRANVLVSGATGSGKTTLLAALLSLVPADERIVCIEESTELAPTHPHVVHLQTRRANVQSVGEVPLTELVRAAMRMRPDRMVLGECRGAEVREVLGALNTGHEGGWATVHANTATDVPARLVALGALAGMSSDTVAAQALSGLDAVVHVRRDAGRRRVAQLGVLGSGERGELVCRPALEIDAAGRLVRCAAWGRLAERLGPEPGAGSGAGSGPPVAGAAS